jgi:hypothetical protein
MTGRANPFGDLGDFAAKPKTQAKPVEPAQIERLASEHGFPSRQVATTPAAPKARPAPEAKAAPRAPAAANKPAKAVRRYTTGRNRQLNLKASEETIERFYRLADAHQVPLAELFELAVDALETAGKGGKR